LANYAADKTSKVHSGENVQHIRTERDSEQSYPRLSFLLKLPRKFPSSGRKVSFTSGPPTVNPRQLLAVHQSTRELRTRAFRDRAGRETGTRTGISFRIQRSLQQDIEANLDLFTVFH
jgi:hypothetical protein